MISPIFYFGCLILMKTLEHPLFDCNVLLFGLKVKHYSMNQYRIFHLFLQKKDTYFH